MDALQMPVLKKKKKKSYLMLTLFQTIRITMSPKLQLFGTCID